MALPRLLHEKLHCQEGDLQVACRPVRAVSMMSIRTGQYCQQATPLTAAHQAAEPQQHGRRRGAVGRMQANIRRRQAAAAAAAAAGEERDDEDSSGSDEEVRHATGQAPRALQAYGPLYGLAECLSVGQRPH